MPGSMKREITLKKDWIVTPEAFDKLLGWLDADREIAGQKYERIRQKLLKLFKWRHCFPEEEYADITINRVTRRIWESAPVEVSDPYLYFHGTALNVIREFWRGQLKHKREDIGALDDNGLAALDPETEMNEEEERNREAIRLACMRGCIAELPDGSREFIVRYHHGTDKKEARKALAAKLGITLNVLRIRACRIRDGLRKCAAACMRSVK